MNNILVSLVVAAISAGLLYLSESQKELRNTSTIIRQFIVIFLVAYVALSYFTSEITHDIETCEPNF